MVDAEIREPSSPIPYVVLGAGALAAILAGRPARRELDLVVGDWSWPLPMFEAYRPVVADGFASTRTNDRGDMVPHGGVDLMYRRRTPSDRIAEFKPGTPNGSVGFFMPDRIPVLAARAGTIVTAKQTDRGYAIVVDHGRPWASFYQHLEKLCISERQRVNAGTTIGFVGGDPSTNEKLRHLHFALWIGGAEDGAIDPEPLMRAWPVLRRDCGPRKASA